MEVVGDHGLHVRASPQSLVQARQCQLGLLHVGINEPRALEKSICAIKLNPLSQPMSPTTAIPKGSLILVTGANGYIASNIVDLLLELGYRVRGTVREHKPWLTELFEKRHAKDCFETVVTANMEEPGAFDEAMQDVAGVIHVVGSRCKGRLGDTKTYNATGTLFL